MVIGEVSISVSQFDGQGMGRHLNGVSNGWLLNDLERKIHWKSKAVIIIMVVLKVYGMRHQIKFTI